MACMAWMVAQVAVMAGARLQAHLMTAKANGKAIAAVGGVWMEEGLVGVEAVAAVAAVAVVE